MPKLGLRSAAAPRQAAPYAWFPPDSLTRSRCPLLKREAPKLLHFHCGLNGNKAQAQCPIIGTGGRMGGEVRRLCRQDLARHAAAQRQLSRRRLPAAASSRPPAETAAHPK